MKGMLLIIVTFAVGFIIGAVSAFLLGKGFLREQNRKAYERWRRREKSRQRTWTSKLTHDLKNPLFLIQAFSWTYLDKINKKRVSASELKNSSRKMAETLNRQANKALDILKKSSRTSK